MKTMKLAFLFFVLVFDIVFANYYDKVQGNTSDPTPEDTQETDINDDFNKPPLEESEDNRVYFSSIRLSVINKLTSTSKILQIPANSGVKIEDIKIVTDGCKLEGLNFVSKIKILDKNKVIFDDNLYYPEVSKKVFTNRFYIINLLGCD